MLERVTIRIGFLGAGFISRLHTMWLSTCEVPHVIAAVHDPDPERAAAFASTTGAEVLGEQELVEAVDVVYVTAWTSEHPRLVALAAAAGKPVFCEKPLAVDAATVESMVDTVAAAGVPNQVGLVLRFLPPERIVRHLLADERAGRPLAVVFRDDQFLPVQGQYASTWRSDPARCGCGAMLEHSIHDIDVLRWWFGPVSQLSATTKETHGLALIDDVAAVRIDFESGVTGTLLSVWHDILERQSARHIEVFCERLHVVIEGDIRGPVRWRFTGHDEEVLEGRALLDRLHELGDFDDNPAQAFLAAVAEGRPAQPDFAAALPAHRVVDAIYRSGDSGGAVVHDPEA